MNTTVATQDPQALRAGIIDFVRDASTELSPGEEDELEALALNLEPGTTVYVAHTPRVSVADVIRLALQVKATGFVACPHIVARRLQSETQLIEVLAELKSNGIDTLLLVAGDLKQPSGPYPSTLEVLDSGLVTDYAIRNIGVAGHPEGDRSIGPTLLWQALQRKQEFARRSGVSMRIVTQFGFNPQAILDFDQELTRRGIDLPVHVGLAGPTPLPKLIRYAMRCGIGASLHALMKNTGALAGVTRVATTPEEMLVGLVQGRIAAGETHLVKPHFFCFGGVAATARWLRAVREGAFELDDSATRFTVAA